MTARTATTVCNLALRELGTYRIDDIDTEDSADGEVSRDIYDETILACLGAHEWRFAMKQVELQQGDAPIARYTYTYDLPSDFVRLSAVSEYENMEPPLLYFDVIDSPNTPNVQAIITDSGSVFAEYVYMKTNPAMWPPYFVDLAVARLASRFASPLKSTTERERLEKLSEDRLRVARSIDSVMQPPKSPPQGYWLSAMRGARKILTSR